MQYLRGREPPRQSYATAYLIEIQLHAEHAAALPYSIEVVVQPTCSVGRICVVMYSTASGGAHIAPPACCTVGRYMYTLIHI